ncbi:hypothetical protein lerEdw1_001348, partial [Lerista edwardsae]
AQMDSLVSFAKLTLMSVPHHLACMTQPVKILLTDTSANVRKGQRCELNYNDCLIETCPVGLRCVDGTNNITCLPAAPQRDPTFTKMEGVPPTEPLQRGLTPAWSSFPTPDLYMLPTFTGRKIKTP